MARFLFVVPPLTGHVNPTVSVAEELVRRRHQVAWVGHPTKVRPLLPEGARLFELDEQVEPEAYAKAVDQSRGARGLRAFKMLWEQFFVPLARQMVPGVDAAAGAFDPSVLVVDQQALAGSVVARRRGLPWATLATTSAGVVDPLAALPKVREWMEGQMARVDAEEGLPVGERPDRSPFLVIVFSTEALAGRASWEGRIAWVGPSIAARQERTEFPWDWLRGGIAVLVSLGTVNAEVGERFYRQVVEALGHEPMQTVIAAPPELVGPVPSNVLVRPYVPQLALLRRLSAVVCHGGHNTVCEALANGLPLVVAPIKDDQPVVAQQVEDAGAGVRLRFARLTAAQLRDAVHRVLGESQFRLAAERIKASFDAAGGARVAADRLEELAARGCEPPA